MTAPRAREANDPPSPPDRRPPRRGGGSSPSAYAASAAGGLRGLLRPARRAALAAAGLAGVVLAAGLALAPPAQAQSTTEIWSATMTPAKDRLLTGYIGGSGGVGSLTDTSFDLAGTSYQITGVYIQQADPDAFFIVSTTPALPQAARADLTIIVGGTSLAFSASSGQVGSGGRIREWRNPGFTFTVGTDVSLSITEVDRPELRSGSQVRNNGEIFLFFDENLSDSVPLASAFSITADRSPISVGSVSHPTGDSLQLAELSPRIGDDQRVRLRYTDPTTGDDANAVQDIHGVDAASFAIDNMTNHSSITLPALSAAAVPAAGGTVALTFSRDLDFSGTSTATIRDAFSVTVDGTANAVTGFGGSGKTATLTMADTIEGGQTVVVGYDRSDAGGEALADDDDDKKQVADFTTGENGVPTVANNSTAGPARLASAAVDAAGTRLTLTFNKSLNAETSARAWFTVTADGADVPIKSFQGLSTAGVSFAINFNSGSPIYKDEAVVVVYEKPAGSDGLTDEVNDVPVASFTTGQDGVPAVTNAATTVAPPEPDTAAGTSKVGTGGSGLVLAFDGPLATDNEPPTSAFSITAGGVAIGIGAVLLSSSTTAGAVSLAGLTPKVRQGETVTLTYTDPTSADDTNALQGTTGTDVRSFTVTLTNASTVTTGPPRPPTGLAATALGATIVDLAWTAPADDGDSAITGYKVEVSNTGTSNWTDLEDDTESTLKFYRHSGLSNGDTRHYRVSAINANGTSPASASANATTMTGAHHAVPPTIYGDEIWSATMTVGTPGSLEGYIASRLTVFQGALSPATFNHGGTEFAVLNVYYDSSGNIVQFSPDAPLGAGKYNLHLGPRNIRYDSLASATNVGQTSPNPNWQHGDRVDIRLVEATAPAKPTGLSATAAGNAQIDLAWTAPEDDGGRTVTGYKVEVSDDGSSGSWDDLVADTGSTDTAYSHTGLSAGQTRHYRVSAINAAGTSDESDSDSATTQRTAPDPPAVSAIADGTSKIVVSWRAPANDGGSAVTGYRLQVSPDGASPWSTLVQNTTDTSYTHTGLSAGDTRHYRVYATNGIGTSQPSAVVSDMTQPGATSCTPNPGDYWCGVVTVALHTEGGFDLAYGFADASVTTNTSDTGALSDETFSVGPNNYTIDTAVTGLQAIAEKLEFGLTSTLSAADQEKLVLHVGSRSFAFSDPSVDSSHDYIWSGTGLDWSSATSITLRLRRVPAAPGAPTNLAAEADGGTTIELSWTAPADDGGSAITGYRIEVSDDGSSGSWSELVADTGSAATRYTHDGLSPGDTRHYRVSAINATGTSEPSDSDDATTPVPPTLSSALVNEVGTMIVLAFSENLDRSAGGTPPASAFSVSVDDVSITVDDVVILGTSPKQAWLTALGRTIYQGQAVTVTYTDPTTGDDAAAIQDSDGDDTPSFTTGVDGVPAVVNNSTRTPPLPAPTNFRATPGDAQVTLSWDEPASDSGVTHHDYSYKTDGAYGGWIEIDDSGPGETNEGSFTVTADIVNDTAHTFQLRAGGADGDSLGATSDTVTPGGDPVPTIETVAVTSTPRLTSAGGTEPDTYGRGEQIEFSVTFSEAVEVTGDPQFGFSLGGARVADYASGTGSETLVFVYSVRQDDVDDDGIWVGNHSSGTRTLQLDSDDAIAAVEGGADADLEHDRLKVLAGHKVDGSRVSEDVPEEPVRVTLHLSEADGEVPEDGGAVTVTARASRGSASAFTVTVSAQPVAPATAGDFTLSENRVLRFAENATASTGTVTIAPVDDDVPEPRDAVRVSGAVSGADIADPESVTLSIANDDDLEPFDVAVEGPAQVSVSESAGAATVTVTLTTQGTDRPAFDAHLHYAVQPGTATRGEDWTAPSGTESGTHSVLFATVPPGSFRANGDGNWEARRSFTLGIVNDAEREQDETVVFRVDTGSRTYQSAPHTITIDDDDGPPGAPAAPELAAVQGSFTSLEADWDEPALDGAAAVTGYELQYREGAGGAWTGWRHEGASTTARLTGLAAETAYRVRVRALNGAEAGGWSPPSEAVLTGAYTIRGICNRTQRVEDRIMVRLEYVHSFKGGCGDVTEVELAKVEHLFLRRNPSTEGTVTVSLRRQDFEGLWNLVELDLADTRLSSLPAGVFAGLTDLEVLNLNKNRLRSLPAGVFAGLRSLEKLRLQKNPSLRSVPYDELEALPALTLLRVDPEGRRTLQVAGGVADAELEVPAGGAATYRVRLMHRPAHGPTERPAVTVRSDTAGVTVSPATLRFTKANWFRSQTVTVRAAASLAGETARVEHDSTAVTLDRDPPALAVRVLEPLRGRFVSPPGRHDGEKRIKVRVAFSEPVEGSPQNVGAHGVRVNAGRVTSARRVGGGVPDGAAARSPARSSAPAAGGAPGAEVVWEFEVEPDSEADLTVSLVAGRPCEAAGAICTADGRALSEGISTTVRGPQTEPGPAPLTASFEGMPGEHDGAGAFTFRVAFSEPIGIGYRSLREDAFAVSGGRVTGGRRVDDRRDLFEMTVEPDGEGDVTVTLPAGRDCGVSGAICTKGENRRQLTNTPTATVAGPAVETGPAGLTARFVDMPAEHDGTAAFKLRIAFSETIRMSGRRLRGDVVSVSGGRATKARAVNGRKDRWDLTVEPASLADVTVTLSSGAACDSPAAVCTADGKALSHTLSATVKGPVAVSVADARVREAAGATLDFAVSLSRAAAGPVSVTWATADGSATAGSDYRAGQGKLRFAPGETEKTIPVPVLDDAHDEGEETMQLRLTAASGAAIADGVATGTIENTDHMPAAWLARFGRTVTDQVLDAVGERLAAPRAAGARVRLAGQALPSWDGDAKAGANDNAGAGPGTGSGAGASERALAARDREAMTAVRDWMARSGAGGPGAGDPWGEGPEDRERSRALTGRDFLIGTSFALTGGSAEAGGYAALWGRGAISRFDGREGDLTLDGEVTTGLMGADWASGPGSRRWTAGLAVGHARGTGGYREGGGCTGGGDGSDGADGDRGASRCAGEVEATLTGLWPYGGLQLTDRLSAWGAAGYGAGEMRLTPGGGSPFTADLTMAMGAAGLRGEVLTPPEEGGLALAVKGDARFTRTASEATRDADGGRLAAATADVWLLRAGIEGSRRFVLAGSGSGTGPGLGSGAGGDAGGMVLTPSFELGARLDGGDAETGLGVDLGGGLAFAAPRQGVALDLKGRGLIAHEASGFREWGASAALTWDPRPTTDRGLALRLRQSWGGSPAGGMDALLGRETLAGLAANDDGGTASAGRFGAELGFGLPLFGGGFTGTPNLGIGFSETGRDYRVGWRLTSARKGDPGFAIDLDATRREAANAEAEHGLMLRGTIRW